MFNFNFGPGFGGHPHMQGGGGMRSRREVDNNKFYNLLGVEKTADEAAIKKAFRRAAMQHHPDKGGDPEKFKEISKAYEVLSDAEKRHLYDEGGEEALEGGVGGGGGMDIFDLFGMGSSSSRRPAGKQRGEDVVFPLKVSLEDLYKGTSKKLRLTKSVLCDSCKGKGGAKEITCKDCKGQGVRLMIRQLGPGMIQQMQTTCSTCKGSGSSIADKDKCKKCKGEKTTKEKKTLEVFVNRGMKHGDKITFTGEADEEPDKITGDVVVVLQQQEHAVFKRQGQNLLMKHNITLVEALTGFSFQIPHLDGRVLIVHSEVGHIYKPGTVKSIRDQGMPHPKNPFQRGHLYVEFAVQFPENSTIDEASKQALRRVLPPPIPGPDYAKALNEDLDMNGDQVQLDEHGNEIPQPAPHRPEDVHLTDVDLEEERRQQHEYQRETYEEDDEEEHRHHRGAQQCRTQ